jgi:hypothetical protein
VERREKEKEEARRKGEGEERRKGEGRDRPLKAKCLLIVCRREGIRGWRRRKGDGRRGRWKEARVKEERREGEGRRRELALTHFRQEQRSFRRFPFIPRQKNFLKRMVQI